MFVTESRQQIAERPDSCSGLQQHKVTADELNQLYEASVDNGETETTFVHLDLSGEKITTDLHAVQFLQTDMIYTVFEGLDLRGNDFSGACLDGAEFINCALDGTQGIVGFAKKIMGCTFSHQERAYRNILNP